MFDIFVYYYSFKDNERCLQNVDGCLLERVHNKFLVAWIEGVRTKRARLNEEAKRGSLIIIRQGWYVLCVCIDDMSLTLKLSMQMMLIFLVYENKKILPVATFFYHNTLNNKGEYNVVRGHNIDLGNVYIE